MTVFLAESCCLYRIGSTLDVHAEMMSMSTHFPAPPTLLATIDGSRKAAAEARAKFSHLMDHGEWYKPDPSILEYFKGGHARTPEPSGRPDMDALFRYNFEFGPGMTCTQKLAMLKFAERVSVGEAPMLSMFLFKKEVLIRGGKEGAIVSGGKIVKTLEGVRIVTWDDERRLGLLRADGRADIRPPSATR